MTESNIEVVNIDVGRKQEAAPAQVKVTGGGPEPTKIDMKNLIPPKANFD